MIYKRNKLSRSQIFTAMYVGLFLFGAGFFISASHKPKSPETLKSASPFPIGAAVNPYLLQNNTAYRQVVETEFNSLTAENVLKWGGVHPTENTFDFSKGDILVNFALAHHQRFHGHNLCWYQYNPKWLSSFQGDSSAWEKLFKTHIQTVVAHYKGKITAWDVVNEAFNDNGFLRVESTDTINTNNDKGCVWARHIGKDYVARAFMYAHEADPNALLFYNDYNQEIDVAKLNAIITMVNDFKKRGIPINGLGLQMHINLNTPLQGITNAIKQCAATGLKLHIAELDISVNPKSDPNVVYTEDLQAKQGAMYAFVVQQYKALVPPQQQYGITIWNVGDADSWIRSSYHRKDWPLLFDDNYGKKAVYYAFLKALKQ